MMHRHCVVMFIVVFWLREVACGVLSDEEGPYEARVTNLSTCVLEKPWFHANVSTYTSNGRTLLRGQVLTRRTIKAVKFGVSLSYIRQGKVKAFEMRNKDCHNLVVRVVLQALGIKYNAQRCTMEPSTSEFTNLDLDAVFHVILHSLWYGPVVLRWQIAASSTPIMCLDIDLQMLKLDANKTTKTQ